MKRSLAYISSSIINSLGYFFVALYLVNNFDIRDYGLWSLYEITISLLNLVILFGMDASLIREYTSQTSKKDFILSNAYGVVVLVGLISIAIVVSLQAIFKLSSSYSLIIVTLISLFESISNVTLTFIRVLDKTKSFLFIHIAKIVIFLVFLCFLVPLLNLLGALLARLLSAIVTTFLGCFLIRNYIKLGFDQMRLISMIRYGLPLLATNVIVYIFLSIDRYIIQIFLSIDLVAIYSFAYRNGMIVDILVNRPFDLYWSVKRFQIYQDHREKFSEALIVYLRFAILVGLLIVTVNPLIYSIISNDQYHQGNQIVHIILLAYTIRGLSYPLNVGTMIKDKTRELPFIGFFTIAIYLFIVLPLIYAFGIFGVAWAFVVANLVWTILIAISSLRVFYIRYQILPIISLISFGFFMYTILLFLDMFHLSNLVSVIIRLLILFIFTTFYGYPLYKNRAAFLKPS